MSLILFQRCHPGGRVLAGRAIYLATSPNGGGEILQHGDSVVPVNARISDADAALQAGGSLLGNLLVALVDVGLDHDTNNRFLALTELVTDDLGNLGLVVVVLLGVAYNLVSSWLLSKGKVSYRENSQS